MDKYLRESLLKVLDVLIHTLNTETLTYVKKDGEREYLALATIRAALVKEKTD